MSNSETTDSVLDRIPSKGSKNLRLITFNINGFRTLFHYHPWNQLRSLNSMFDSLKVDIITLQELKVGAKDINNKIGKIDGYNSFLTIPQQKKGYSGVGVYVRIPSMNECDSVRDSLTVIKAEEGITGALISNDTKKPYLESEGIGGYVDLDSQLAEKIDSEGRCILLEFMNNTVVISTYCPANSMGTEEGEIFRVEFFKVLFKRIQNLEKLGKNVVLMGDVNISRGLIDSAESLEAYFKAGLIKECEDFEFINKEQNLEFIKSSIPKTMLNQLIVDSPVATDAIMYDTVRQIQGSKRSLYTVWNTIKNSRPGNFGSRIDLILVTKGWNDVLTHANIWPFLMGSDHCPVYSDFDVSKLKYEKSKECKLPKLEAKYVYKLSTGDISSMFTKTKSVTLEPPKKIRKTTQNSISNFFTKQETEKPIPFDLIKQLEEEKSIKKPGVKPNVTISKGRFKINSEVIPNCKHDKPCILKTSMNSKSKGKKFWTCSKDVGTISNEQDKLKYSCGFFQWK